MGSCKWRVDLKHYWQRFVLSTERVSLFGARDNIMLSRSDTSMDGYECGDLQFGKYPHYSIIIGGDYEDC